MLLKGNSFDIYHAGFILASNICKSALKDIHIIILHIITQQQQNLVYFLIGALSESFFIFCKRKEKKNLQQFP